ncbi:MAG TPA: pentapeptide repeat-containing protein [Candidatus Eremiobacteraceae bacterium]|nr:pentapeptide repeat-containing protein [Candidatus Eremiobacteraceae bacterium]
MPEQPAKSFFGFTWGSGAKQEERLATPEELAEYGVLAPDPATEAKILALFEQQLLQDLIKEAPAQTVTSGNPAAVTEDIMEIPVNVNDPAEARKDELAADIPLGEPRIDSATELETEPIPVLQEMVSETPASTPTELQTEETVAPELSGDAPADEVEECSEAPSEPELAEQYEPQPALHASSGDLVEFAQVLDQHRLWVESGGTQGAQGHFAGADLTGVDLTGANLQGAELQKANLRGADLSMANLRGANLVEADLRETNLLGAEFSGANLMGANLYGAQGLWAGRLGGANLFDATLPEEVAALTGRKTIEQFTQSARWFYLLLMGLCVGACGLIGLTSDVRLLLDESATFTTRIPKILPLQGFYLGAPLLLTVFYLRLQFLLLRLWGSMGALPAVFPDGQTPEKDGRWYLMGPIRPYLRWTREPRSAVSMLECYVAMLLAYWAVPAVLLVFWLRYLVMQDYRGTLLHLVLFTLASAAACGLPRVVRRVLRPGDWTEESTPQFLHDVLHPTRVPVLIGMTLFLLSLGVIRGLPGDTSLRPEVAQADPRRWAATAFQFVGYRPYADLTEESVSARPNSAATGNGSGIEANGPRLNEINLRYSRGFHAAFANARMWRANLEGSSLAEADFRGANLREANLRSAKMDRVLAEKANLVSVDARGAAFSGGDFHGSDWSFANLGGVVLTTADLQGATMYAVNLREANLLRADLGHTDLRDTHLEDAVLSLAKLEQTDFSAAKMNRANLTGAEAKGTIFLEADLSKADLRGATFAGAVLRQAKLDEANVMGADFRGALGLEAWQVCATQGWRGAQFDPDVLSAVQQSCGTTPAAAQPQSSH